MAAKRHARKHSIIVLDLKEREWVRVLEVPVPEDLLWLAGIDMLHPVQFAPQDLRSLTMYVWAHSTSVKKPYERKVFNRLLDKMYTALEPHAGEPRCSTQPSSSQNNKRTALAKLRRWLPESEKKKVPGTFFTGFRNSLPVLRLPKKGS